MKTLRRLRLLPHFVLAVVGVLCLIDAIDNEHFPQFGYYSKLAASFVGCVVFVISLISLPKLFLDGASRYSGWFGVAVALLALGVMMLEWGFVLTGMAGVVSVLLIEAQWGSAALERRAKSQEEGKHAGDDDAPRRPC